jgi:hypothetical protein
VPSSGKASTGAPSTAHTLPTIAKAANAQIAVPVGWRLTAATDTPHSDGYQVQGWCLAPKGDSQCVLQLGRITPPPGSTSDLQLDPDETAWGQGSGAQHVCGNALDTVVEQASTSTFGNRTADYRQWDWSCHGKPAAHEAQYVVLSAPAWAIAYVDPQPYRGHDASDYLTQLRWVAAQSVLPAATGGMRYADRGTLQSATRDGSVERIVIRRDRHVQLGSGSTGFEPAGAPATATYAVPVAKYTSMHVTTGRHVEVYTDGSTVIGFYPDPAAG